MRGEGYTLSVEILVITDRVVNNNNNNNNFSCRRIEALILHMIVRASHLNNLKLKFLID
jgi:hypothetical protein